MQTNIDLCGQALLKIGENPIASFNDDSAAARIAAGLYDPAIDALLCRHPWRFARKKYLLPRTFDGDFIIPGNILAVNHCDAASYEIAGDKIIADADEIEVFATARVDAESFPPYFAAAAIAKLAMEFCIPMTGNQNLYAMLNALFESKLRSAKLIDSASAPSRGIGEFSLTTSRF